MKETEIYERAIKWAEKHGVSAIKANTDNYERPSGFKNSKNDESVIPDITGTKRGSICYVEIADKSEDSSETASKWKLLGNIASMKNGRLFVLAPRGCKSFADNLVKDNNISAEVVSL